MSFLLGFWATGVVVMFVLFSIGAVHEVMKPHHYIRFVHLAVHKKAVFIGVLLVIISIVAFFWPITLTAKFIKDRA